MRALLIPLLLGVSTASAACNPFASFDQQVVHCYGTHAYFDGHCPGDRFECELILRSNSCYLMLIGEATFKTTSPDGTVDGPWVFASSVIVKPGELVRLPYPVTMFGEIGDAGQLSDEVKFAGWYQVPPAGQTWETTPWWRGTWKTFHGGYSATIQPAAECAGLCE